MALGIDAMRSMAKAFDEAGSVLRAAHTERGDAQRLIGQLDEQTHGVPGKVVRSLEDQIEELASIGTASSSNAIKGARAVLAEFDAQQLPVHMQTRIEVGGARDALEGISIWGADLESIGSQFRAVAAAIEHDIAARMTQQF